MAVCQAPFIVTIQLAQCNVDAGCHLSQTSKLKNLTKAEYSLQSKTSSCLSTTMVRSHEPEDTATSELRTSTACGPLQIQGLELSILGAHTAELIATAGSGVDAQAVNFHSSLGRPTDLIEAGSVCSEKSHELNLEGRPSKRIRSCTLENTEGNKRDLENDNLQLKCTSRTIEESATLAGSNTLASSFDKDLSGAHTSNPVELKMAKSCPTKPGHCSPGSSLSQQLTYGTFNKVGQRDSQLKQSTSKSRDSSDFIQDTILSSGLEVLESSLVHGKPTYLHSICKRNNKSTTYSSNIGPYIRDEIIPMSTGLFYGNISEPVTSYDNEVFRLHHSPIELGQTNLAQWHLPLLQAEQDISRTDFPNGILPENISMDLHPTCSFERKRSQDLRLSQRGTEFVPNPNTIFGLSLPPEFSNIQPNKSIPEIPFETQLNSEMLLQNLQASSYSGTCAPFLSSMKYNENFLYDSDPSTSNFDMLQSLNQKSSTDSILQDRRVQLPPSTNVLNSAKKFPHFILDQKLSELMQSKSPTSSLALPHSFPSSSKIFASANNLCPPTQGMGSNLLGLSNSSPGVCGLLIGLDENEVLPSISVEMEGRSIGGSVCLQKLDGYESFALILSDMFNNNAIEDNVAPSAGNCTLSNAIPGFVIAYEDAEGDLLLAGDLSWRDFVRVARRIRVIPAKKNKMKGSF